MTFGLPIWGLPFLPNDTEYSKKMVFVWRLIISHVIRHCKFYCRVQHFSGKNSATNWNKEPDEEKIYRSTEFFLKLDNNGWEMHTGARARKQKYLCIYISLYMKTFLKTGVYTYNIYIYLSGFAKTWPQKSLLYILWLSLVVEHVFFSFHSFFLLI